MTSLTQRALSAGARAMREYATIWLVATIGVALSLFGFGMLRRQLDVHKAVEFDWVAHNRYRALEAGLQRGLDAVRSLGDLVRFSPDLPADDFAVMAESVMRRTGGLSALAWVPRVTDETRSEWAGSAGGDRPKTIVERALLGSLEPAPVRPVYFPVHLLEPETTAMFPPGLDLAADPLLGDVLKRARASRATAVSGRLQLGPEASRSFGFVAAHPIFEELSASDVAADRGTLRGLVLGLFSLSDLARVAIDPLEPRGVDCLIRDESGASGQRFLDFYASRLGGATGLWDEDSWRDRAPALSSQTFRLADREWSVTCAPTARFRSAEAFEAGPWVALAGGIFLTLLLTSYLVRSRLSMLQRLEMERTLRDREEVFWQMTETVSEVFWATAADRSRFLYISPAFEQVWGISCEDLYADPELYVWPILPEDRGTLEAALSTMRASGSPVEAVFRLGCDDGTVRWIRDRAFPVLDEAGGISRVVGFAEDISEERMARDALRSSEKRLRDLFNQSPDIILTVDRQGLVLFINRSTPELPFDLAIGRDSSVLVPAEMRERYRSTLEKVFDTGEIDHFEFTKADSIWWELRLVPLVQRDAVVSAMAIVTDVTENRDLQDQAARNARLASIGVLAAGVAHEINNPNNAILFNATVLARAWSDAAPILDEYCAENGEFALASLPFSEASRTLPELLSQITMNSKRIQRIVENLKHLSRKDRRELASSVDIAATLEAAVEILRSQIQARTDRFELHVDDALPTVRGNSQQLEQVFINVILNALQALPERDRSVTVQAAPGPGADEVSIRVRDQGEGISTENLDALTEPFFSTREDSGGTGLGLSISQSIIDRHGGRIGFESTPEHGTTVTITLTTQERTEE